MDNETRATKLRVGILGAANIAERYVIPALLMLDDLYSLDLVASKSRDKAEKLSKKFDIEFVDSYKEVVDHESIDLIYIPLPNALHYEWVKKSLLAGKHVLVEKSMACSLEEVIELNRIAKKKRLALVENFQFRFHSQLKLIKEIIRSGELGEIRNIKSSFGFPPFKESNNIRYSKELGGGALLDAGAYPLKLAQIILGEDIYVDSASLCYDPSYGVDIWGSAQIKSRKSYAVMQCSFGFDHSYMCSVEIWGSKGVLTANRIFTSPPDNQALVTFESAQETKEFKVSPDNHFLNMLSFIYELCSNQKNLDKEYLLNNLQAKLVHQLREQSNG